MSAALPLTRIERSQTSRPLLTRFLGHPAALLGAVSFTLLILFSLLAWPLAAALGIDPLATDLLSRYDPPSAHHWLGTDEAGRDELVRLMLGGQMSLFIGLAATFLGSLIGLAIGLSAGYIGGILDTLLMRLTDGVMALPLLPFLIVLSAVDLTKIGFSPDLAHSPTIALLRLIVLIAMVEWTGIARIARAATLSVKNQDFVYAAWASGAGSFHVLKTHVLPNITGPLTVTIALTIGRAILFESVLSYLGFGTVPPTPTWGNMLANAQELITTAPALAIYPGILIFATVAAVNLLGDGLQFMFDPSAER